MPSTPESTLKQQPMLDPLQQQNLRNNNNKTVGTNAGKRVPRLDSTRPEPAAANKALAPSESAASTAVELLFTCLGLLLASNRTQTELID